MGIKIGITMAGVVVLTCLTTIATLKYTAAPPPVIPDVPDSIPIVIESHQSATFEATGYAIGSPYNTITKLGQPVINRSFMQVGGIDIFTIAVDPKIIPLGSLVYIEDLGLALATDTGSAIKGMLIDICFTNMDEAMDWGRKDVEVFILQKGK